MNEYANSEAVMYAVRQAENESAKRRKMLAEFSEVLPKHLVGELRIRANVVISTRFSRLGAIGET